MQLWLNQETMSAKCTDLTFKWLRKSFKDHEALRSV